MNRGHEFWIYPAGLLPVIDRSAVAQRGYGVDQARYD
jgi:hypothetical protein